MAPFPHGPDDVTKRPLISVDPIRALQFADIGNDRFDIALCHALLHGHIAKTPVMGLNAAFSRHEKGHIAMMRRLVDLMNQRRAEAFFAGGIYAMTGGADAVERALSDLRMG